MEQKYSSFSVKKEIPEAKEWPLIQISSDDGGSSSSNSSVQSAANNDANANFYGGDDVFNSMTDSLLRRKKRPKLEHSDLGFLKPPLPPANISYTPVVLDVEPISLQLPDNYSNHNVNGNGITNNCNNTIDSEEGATDNHNKNSMVTRSCKQFWKAGDYEYENAIAASPCSNSALSSVGMDHVRVHPRFLHSNATSHKWALGAFAELLDNSLDEVSNGATFVNVDVINNGKDGGNILLVNDNGGGMTPDKMRQCMSLGYSEKSKKANTIGQWDVIVFSRCKGNGSTSATQSVGMLSYTFLTSTGKEDIVVPMIDYEKSEHGWRHMFRNSAEGWEKNLATILQWSPYLTEQDLLQQLDTLGDHGTRIIIYNLWEDDEGHLELDFDVDSHDIQIRGVNRDEKNIKMAQEYESCRHFLTYQHSLRSYASLLYLSLPPHFRIILRGKDVKHHNIVNDMMLTQEIVYRPKEVTKRIQKGTQTDSDVFAAGTIGFVKDAKAHIDVQGFNVYHKNRLIKPFWRVWNAAGSDGRGCIGVLEANFVEPAHDKQGFERTIVLQRLEQRLICIQKQYWSRNCQKIGYAARRPITDPEDKANLVSNEKKSTKTDKNNHGPCNMKVDKKSSPVSAISEDRSWSEPKQHVKVTHCKGAEWDPTNHTTKKKIKLEEGNFDSGERIMETQNQNYDVNSLLNELKHEREKCKSLEAKVQELQQKVDEADKEQSALIDILVEEKVQREEAEERLRKKLRDASSTLDGLLEKVKRLEGR